MKPWKLRLLLVLSLTINAIAIFAAVLNFLDYQQVQSLRQQRPSRILCDGEGNMYTQDGAPVRLIFGDTEITAEKGCPARWTSPR
jgi:hypothetical protein